MKTAKYIIRVINAMALAIVKAVAVCIVWAVCFIFSLLANIAGGVIQFAIGGIIILLSVVAFFGFILWLFTL